MGMKAVHDVVLSHLPSYEDFKKYRNLMIQMDRHQDKELTTYLTLVKQYYPHPLFPPPCLCFLPPFRLCHVNSLSACLSKKGLKMNKSLDETYIHMREARRTFLQPHVQVVTASLPLPATVVASEPASHGPRTSAATQINEQITPCSSHQELSSEWSQQRHSVGSTDQSQPQQDLCMEEEQPVHTVADMILSLRDTVGDAAMEDQSEKTHAVCKANLASLKDLTVREVLSPQTAARLSELVNQHRRITSCWNSDNSQLIDCERPIGATNGEMTLGSRTILFSTLSSHPNIPYHARLGTNATHRFLDIGSGYGLAVLHAAIQCQLIHSGGLEAAVDRVEISHRLTHATGMSDHAEFMAAHVGAHAQALPIICAATHIFAFSCVFHQETREYLAKFMARTDSCWLVYVNFDSPEWLVPFVRALGVSVHIGRPHTSACSLGGVHLLGKISGLMISGSGQTRTGYVYLRCLSEAQIESHTNWRKRGIDVLSDNSKRQAKLALDKHEQLLKSNSRQLRERKEDR